MANHIIITRDSEVCLPIRVHMGAVSRVVNYVGYHATTLENARRILQDGFRCMSVGARHWLGNGFYFFEASPGWARWWMLTSVRGAGAIIEAHIAVPREAVLDLLDLDDWRRFHEYRKKAIAQLRRRHLRGRTPFTLDAVVINHLCADGVIRLVRAAFPEPDGHVDETVRLHESRIRRIHVQLCCRDSSCITSLSLVHTGV